MRCGPNLICTFLHPAILVVQHDDSCSGSFHHDEHHMTL